MSFTPNQQDFAARLTACQSRLFAYITAMVPDRNQAHDILQQANLAMLRKADEYDSSRDFVGWACKVAYFEVLAYRRGRARDRHRFDERFLEVISRDAESRVASHDRRGAALADCMGKLNAGQRDLIDQRYTSGRSVDDLASHFSRTTAAISQMLYRIRAALAECVRSTLAAEEQA
ncbi:MAG: sigma-70 family RNA polymerase sigma factor [Phycisphaera sp.]|nr:sigma-70 family RNA polymerase sigma factor [Phycisphaera sp.]